MRGAARTLVASVVAGLLAVTASLAAMVPASAMILDVTCAGSETITYNPPLTLAAPPAGSTVSVSSQYGPCVSTSQPAVTSGAAGLTVPRNTTCLTLLSPAAGTRVITWNTGATSTLSGNVTTQVVGAALVTTILGNVASGLFAGKSFIYQATAPSAQVLLCTLGLGAVPSFTGVVLLEIT